MNSRRDFLKMAASGTAAVAIGGSLPGVGAGRNSQIAGSNERVRVSVMGVNSRGSTLARKFATEPGCEVVHICDVDRNAAEKCVTGLAGLQEKKPEIFGDFRKSLESREVDALVIAAPDHWHAPATLLALEAGKHVYVEKPLSHNPREGEILVRAAGRYDKLIQMGNQRRSWPQVREAIQRLHDGIIGRVYFGRAWYANNRGPIGNGKPAQVPGWLDWDLWQGPAPRREYRDNIVHYKWHWFWHWGTGEALNNGTHFVDLLRWGMGVDYPVRVNSNGGRYRYDDDWETPDTQVISWDFREGVSMTWEGRSCNGKESEGTGVGCIFYGEGGSMMITGSDEYTVFDLKGNVITSVNAAQKVDPLNTSDPGGGGRGDRHVRNFLDSITKGTALNAGIDSGHISTLLLQLGNIAQRVGRSLETDPENGRITGDREAAGYWSREYEIGWEMKL